MCKLTIALLFAALSLLTWSPGASAQFNGCQPGLCNGSSSFGGPGFSSPPAASSGGSFSLTYEAVGSSSTTGTTTISYGTQTYGSGCNALVIPIQWYNTNGGDTVTGVTVGGSAATHLSGTLQSTGNGQLSSDGWQFNSPTGTSAAISVTYSANVTFNSENGVGC
jgi:hypothetical protein